MDSTRAKQIIESNGIIEVLYEGTPVWIENVKDNNTADVSFIKTNIKKDVPIYMLVEKELQ
ncbi:MAG: H-type small acid-soluble spore protein [Clostridiaceae bacterium]|nr:H-type small acid-soluble spore protein [Clostridiaceae bacterium]